MRTNVRNRVNGKEREKRRALRLVRYNREKHRALLSHFVLVVIVLP
jgi:hypothetical protein